MQGNQTLETIKQGHKLSADKSTASGRKLNHLSTLGRKQNCAVLDFFYFGFLIEVEIFIFAEKITA